MKCAVTVDSKLATGSTSCHCNAAVRVTESKVLRSTTWQLKGELYLKIVRFYGSNNENLAWCLANIMMVRMDYALKSGEQPIISMKGEGLI